MKTRLQGLWATAIAAFFLIAFAGGCKDEIVGVDGVCPAVVSTSPSSGASGTPIDRTITVTFNEAMNPATITPGVVTVLSPGSPGGRTSGSSATHMTGSLTYDATTFTITFVPTSKLAPNATYTGTVSSSIKDLKGNSLQTDYVWQFSTNTSVSPTVVSADPANNSTGVFLNKKINATFSTPMDPATLTASTFTVKQGTTAVAGTVTYAGSTASFTPAAALLPNTTYVATISNGAKNASGTTLVSDYVWTFTTGSTTGPEVSSTDPLDLATGVALNKKVSATFNQAMDPLTITSSSFTLMNGPTAVSGSVSYLGTTATFTPTGNLLSGTTYTATITTAAKNVAGTSLSNDRVWNFSTTAPLGPGFVDLKSVEQFGIIAGVGVSNNAGFSEIRDMNVGISPGVRSSITGFPPAIIVNGAMYASDDAAPSGVAAMLTQAKQDLTNAYLFAEGATSPAPAIVAGDQGGKTLAPGIYKSTSTLLIQSGNLTLDAQGDANATWIFQIASDFTTVGGAGGSVILSGGAQAKNVFWQVGSSATIGNFTSFKGNVLALTSITMNSGATAAGRMLARNGSVVMTNTNIINKP
jgi:Ice-binding-like/Bacterial Ig-like domain